MTKFIPLLLTTFLLAASPAEMQAEAKLPRIGYMIAVTPAASANRVKEFQQGLRELGYIEKKNIALDYRYADGKLDRLPALARELVQLKVDVIVTAGGQATRAAKQATSTIPIVMTNDADPVGSGFIASLARPGGNITGLSTLAPELGGKRLEILREIISKLSRVAVIGTSTQPGHVQATKELELAAKGFNLQLLQLDVLERKDIEPAFRAARKEQAEAALTLNSPVFNSHRTRIIELALKYRLPTMYDRIEFVEDGGLMTYGVNFNDLDRRAATYVDKILKGRKPADLPVEQPTKFEFIVNLKAAKQIGLTIPPNVLVRADRVIR